MFLFFFLGKYSSSKLCEEAVNSIYDRVVDELNTSAIVPQLVKQGVLTSEDVQLILSQQTPSEKAMQLLALLPRKGTDDFSYRVLFSALRNDTGNRPHHSLGEHLDELCQSELLNAHRSVKLYARTLIFVPKSKPLKSGHLSSKDTFYP